MLDNNFNSSIHFENFLTRLLSMKSCSNIENWNIQNDVADEISVTDKMVFMLVIVVYS